MELRKLDKCLSCVYKEVPITLNPCNYCDNCLTEDNKIKITEGMDLYEKAMPRTSKWQFECRTKIKDGYKWEEKWHFMCTVCKTEIQIKARTLPPSKCPNCKTVMDEESEE